MTHPPGDESRFYTEVLKLLLQVITSDDKLEPEELEEFSQVAARWNVPAAEVAAMLDRLRAGKPLPAPDMGLLRTRPQDVIQAARVVAASDQHVDNEEIEMLMQIRTLLGI
ncbi:TerB family tellurite resistance protein [Hyalangium versicolor]|uniref:TerB family tellurite resistance protein n=1 Tax=Hyalangium versicolor TaxID=2861190 RepID=UPI001CCB7864|nr:TerB family tellurite resistance protein [Hyalangium versicolor]